MELLPVYFRRIHGRTVGYRDALCLETFVRFGPYKGPKRISHTVTINCYQWRVVWVA